MTILPLDARFLPDKTRSLFERLITGKRLLDYARDYVVDGAKMTFFARGAGGSATQEQLDWLAAAPRAYSGIGFDVLGIEGIFAMKALLLADRARSRDLFDLMALIQDHGYTLDQAFGFVKKLAPIERRDIERHKAVMTGVIPLDPEDEGFESIGVKMPMEDIYAVFEEQIAGLERTLARAAMGQGKARQGKARQERPGPATIALRTASPEGLFRKAPLKPQGGKPTFGPPPHYFRLLSNC
jgi:hypothetical protein